MNGKAWNLLINVLQGFWQLRGHRCMLLRTVVCIAIALEPWCNRRWCRFRIPAELRLLPSVRYYRGQITDIREFSRHCSHVGFVKQGKVVRFSVGVILRKATYVYLTAVYQGAILDGCWGKWDEEKREIIFFFPLHLPPHLFRFWPTNELW